ncbi:hypothetical protein ACIBF5_13900 [Micromonospora sp. NPDC050417]
MRGSDDDAGIPRRAALTRILTVNQRPRGEPLRGCFVSPRIGRPDRTRA